MNKDQTLKKFIDKIFEEEIRDFSTNFEKDYSMDGKKAKNIVDKNNNVFIAALGRDIMVYSALMRSLDSSLGNRIEKIAKRIAEKNYIVENGVKGFISVDTQNAISSLLEAYKSRRRKPQDKDLEQLSNIGDESEKVEGEKKSDYYLTLIANPKKKYLLELKIGGDLDNKKAESEKSALLHQYATLRSDNKIKRDDDVKIFFCTAYNKFGDEQIWNQERVMQFFSPGEILIGRDFWNFISRSDEGYDLVLTSYKKYSPIIKETLEKIIKAYSEQVGSLG